MFTFLTNVLLKLSTQLVQHFIAHFLHMKHLLIGLILHEEFEIIRWVVLAGTNYIKRMRKFVERMNLSLRPQKIKLQLVMSTGQSIGSLLFNNKVRDHGVDGSRCTSQRCHVCSENLRENDQLIVSPTNGRSYPVNKSLSCTDRGIYSITCACTSLYTSKTSTSFSQRFSKHFRSAASAVFEHSKSCSMGSSAYDYSVQFLVCQREIFSLREGVLMERKVEGVT